MSKSTVLIRIRFPVELVARLDRLAEELFVETQRRVSRAALIRALVMIHMTTDDESLRKISAVLAADPVKRGRAKGRRAEEEPVLQASTVEEARH